MRFHCSLIVAVVIFLDATAAGQGQLGRVTLTGVVTDSSGSPLPGAQITVEGRDGQIVTTDSRGAFEVPNLSAGPHVVRAGLPGFRTRTLQVSLPVAPLTFVLRLGLLSHPHYVLPDPEEAVRDASAIARVRLDALAPPMDCADLDVISAVHNATVLDVWKGQIPEAIQILESDAGACIEEDGSVAVYGRANSNYTISAEYIVLLSGTGPRFGGLGDGDHVFPVRERTVSTKGFFGLAATVPLRDFEARLRQLAK